MSDHAMIFVKINLPKPPAFKILQKRRKFGTLDHDTFGAELGNKLSDIHYDEDIDLFVKQIDDTMTAVLDKLAPVSTSSSRVRHRPRWYNSDVDDARRLRRRAERKWRKTKSEFDLVVYHERQDDVRSAVHCAKSDYLKQSFSSNSQKEIYRSINMLLNRKDRVLPDTSSTTQLANAFCRFFTTKIKNIRCLIDDRNTAVGSKLVTASRPKCELSHFCKLTEEDVQRLVNQSTSKSSPSDPLPTWLLKRHISSVLSTLTELVNASLTSGTFPASLGIAVITPVLKKTSLDRNNLQNYRPVSNIRYLAKLIETAAASQLTSYIESNNLSDPMQSAYRSCYSTETGLVCIKDFICTTLTIREQYLSSVLTYQLHLIPSIKIFCQLVSRKCMGSPV